MATANANANAAVITPIDYFTEAPAQLITGESCLSIATFRDFIFTLEYGTSTFAGVFIKNELLEIYTGDKPPYKSVWKKGNDPLKNNIDLQTIHFRFKNDVLNFTLLRGTFNKSIFRYSISHFRRPGQGIGEAYAAVEKTSAALKAREEAIIRRIKGAADATKKAGIAAAAAAATAARKAAQAVKDRLTAQKQKAAEDEAAQMAAQMKAQEGKMFKISPAESDAAPPYMNEKGKMVLPYKTQTSVNGTFYADVMNKDGVTSRVEGATKAIVDKAVAKFAADLNFTVYENAGVVNTSTKEVKSDAKGYYKILGVPTTASIDDIRKAYRKLAAIHDTNTGADVKIMQQINEAYGVLKDIGSKNAYNSTNANGANANASSTALTVRSRPANANAAPPPTGAGDPKGYYAILGVPPTASLDDIRKAHRKLALIHHTNKGGDLKMIQKINEAYDALKDADSKNAYNLS
jgi:DnaJ-domain-containing protein 1